MTTPLNLLPPRSSTPFFRRPSLSNSLSSTRSSSSSSSSSSQDSDPDLDSDSSLDYPQRTSLNRHSSQSSTESTFPTTSTTSSLPQLSSTSPSSSSSSIKRSDLKLSLTYLRARQSLTSSSYESLSTSLRTLSSLLPNSSSREAWESIGVFVPILERFVRDLRGTLGREEKASKEYRKGLNKDDAKALVGLRQRWVGGNATEGKGKRAIKEKDAGLDWAQRVQELVKNNVAPDQISPDSDSVTSLQTQALLNSIESLLLPSCSCPRISLQNLQLTTWQLSQWTRLERIQQTIEWYLSFSGIQDSSELSRKARTVLDSVKSLDLSRNQLTSFPSFLPRLFPNLESLSLSHNAFTHLPPSLTLFSNLRRLKLHGNLLVQSQKALLPLHKDSSQAQRPGKGTRSNVRQIMKDLLSLRLSQRLSSHDSPNPVRSLFSISLEILHSFSSSSLYPSTDDLPPHLLEALSDSYLCSSCTRFILPSSPSYTPPFFERLHFLSPGINLPAHSFNHKPSSEDEGNNNRATLEQLVLLVAYQRVENAQTSSKRFLNEKEAGRREKKGGGLSTIVRVMRWLRRKEKV
ncbi:hypothetical protein JCM5353_008429 [Sporobolomyces roseus]